MTVPCVMEYSSLQPCRARLGSTEKPRAPSTVRSAGIATPLVCQRAHHGRNRMSKWGSKTAYLVRWLSSCRLSTAPRRLVQLCDCATGRRVSSLRMQHAPAMAGRRDALRHIAKESFHVFVSSGAIGCPSAERSCTSWTGLSLARWRAPNGDFAPSPGCGQICVTMRPIDAHVVAEIRCVGGVGARLGFGPWGA